MGKRLTIVTNIRAPYRDDVFRELQRRFDLAVYLLANDEPGRGWGRRTVPYGYRGVPALRFRGKDTPWYVPFPTWLKRPGPILLGGFGPSVLITAALRPKSTLIWSEATETTDASVTGIRRGVRRWLVRRSLAGVAVGEASRDYLVSLGATSIIMLPNAADIDAMDGDADIVVRDALAVGTVIAHVGEWSFMKGADEAAKMYRALVQSGGGSSAAPTFLVAGNVADAELPDGAVYLGYLPHDQLWDVLKERATSFLVLLSRGDRWGFVVPEAIAQGILPIVTRDVACTADIVQPVAPGLVVTGGLEAARVIEALRSNPAEYSEALGAVQSLLRTRTAAWAAGVFERGLERL